MQVSYGGDLLLAPACLRAAACVVQSQQRTAVINRALCCLHFFCPSLRLCLRLCTIIIVASTHTLHFNTRIYINWKVMASF
jgi:hypothetical protein